ncbi:MAG: DNA repair protein RecN [Tannerellaceae bacterium]|jgi:DNA repair protein RecN (Recombination protein N)|nr:DNA repair protein RecN [Tannerellaceae bacterium]
MLKSLYIQNYVLIDNLNIRFTDSFTVITGETGAGKSIILGALGLVLGQRFDSKGIKGGEDKCVIEAVFDISAYRLQSFFEGKGLEYDTETCILRRELFASGKSRAFVNDSPASLNDVKELGNLLIDIHSQHQNLLLADTKFQLKVVDVMAQNEFSLTQYKKEYTFYQSLKRQLKELLGKVAQSRQDEDYIRYQLEQLSEAKLTEGEQDELEKELATLSHAEEIKSALYKIAGLLNGEEQGSVQLLKEALSASEVLEKYYPGAKEITERLRTAYIDLNDLASETGSRGEDIEFSPERLQWVNERLDLFYSLEQKHRVSTVEELITLREAYGKQLATIDSFDEQINELTARTEASYRELKKLASQLRAKRKKASESIAKELMNKLSFLGMPNTRFRIDFIEKPEPESDGTDDVRFMFSANKSGGALERVAQTASGGEISRLMLCIKAMIAGFTALPAIIFDEVDMGVSGDIADKMGVIMQELGNKMQVIAITHLPQIASKGKEHYYVYKQDAGEHTVTQIKKLTNEERITEVARMLSGATLTDASVANARELLNLNITIYEGK